MINFIIWLVVGGLIAGSRVSSCIQIINRVSC